MSTFRDKIHTFITSENKLQIIRQKMSVTFFEIKNKRSFGELGRNCMISKPLIISGKRHIFLRDGVNILPNARIEAISYYNGVSYEPKIEIGERTSFGQNLHMICCKELTIGKDVTFSANVYISDVAHEYRNIGENVLMQPVLVKPTHIGDNCFIGYGACIHPGVTLGKQCIVGSNAVVLAGDYPDYSVLAGVPAKTVKRYDVKSGEWKK